MTPIDYLVAGLALLTGATNVVLGAELVRRTRRAPPPTPAPVQASAPAPEAPVVAEVVEAPVAPPAPAPDTGQADAIIRACVARQPQRELEHLERHGVKYRADQRTRAIRQRCERELGKAGLAVPEGLDTQVASLLKELA